MYVVLSYYIGGNLLQANEILIHYFMGRYVRNVGPEQMMAVALYLTDSSD